MKVAIVENEFIMQMHIQDIVEKMGHTVCGLSSNYEDAIQLVNEHKPNIVLLDICLDSEKSGIDVANFITTHYNSNVIFVTGSVDKHTIEKAINSNPLGIIEKPFGNDQFMETFLSLTKAINKFEIIA